jgi:hypothetical protein
VQAEGERRRQPGKALLGQAVAATRIADDADGMAEARLLGCEVADVPEQAPDGRAQAMQDAQRRLRIADPP